MSVLPLGSAYFTVWAVVGGVAFEGKMAWLCLRKYSGPWGRAKESSDLRAAAPHWASAGSHGVRTLRGLLLIGGLQSVMWSKR